MFSMQPPNNGTATRTCKRCGKPLSPNEVYCDNCGVYNGLPPTNNINRWTQPPAAPVGWGAGAPAQQPSYGTGQYGEQQQWGQASTSPASNGLNGGYSSPQQPFYSNNSYSSATQTPQSSSPGNYYNASQQGYGYSPSSPTIAGDLQPGSERGLPSGFDQMPQPPTRKRGRKPGLIIGLSILVVILISAAFLGYAFVANKNAKTVSVTPTPESTPTPSGKPLFKDSFDNNNNGWDLTSNPGQFAVQVGGGKMVLEDDDNKLLWEIVPGKTFSDFTLTVDTVLSKGDPNNGYGLYIRGGSSQDSQLGTYYRFELYGDGTYAIFKGVLDGSSNTQSNKLVGYLASPSIQKQGIVNHMKVIAKGQNMTFIVNGQVLSKITDNNYRGGLVALFVSNLPGSPPVAQATFSNLAIYPS